MPWYDYQCEKCGTVFEVNRSMTETSKPKCHACGSTRTVRIYSAAPVVFKGSGFYATDSGSRGSTTSSNDHPTPAGTPAPATESKPAPAPAAESKPSVAPADAATPSSPERKSA
jgi:putative FmdB family regulatory protein